MTLFEKHETALVSTTQKFDTSSSMGRLMLNVLMSFAEFERQVIGERIRDKLAAAKRKGKYTGGRPPLGYDVDRQAMRLVVNPEEAKVVRFIFERFLKLCSGMRVAQELNAKGYRTKAWTTRKGQPHGGALWNKVYVYLILSNRRYLGEVVHQGQVYRGEHEALIDRATWDKVQAILSTSRARRSAQTRRKTVAMLKGLVKCGHCGKAMGDTYTRKKGKHYRYYVCTSAEKIGYASCPVRSVPAGEIEGAVLQYLKNIFRSPEVIARTVQAMHRQVRQERADLAREQQTLDQRLAELRKMIRSLVEAGGQTGGGALADELRRLNDEYAAAERRLAEVDAGLTQADAVPEDREVVAALRQIDPVWDELFPAEKHRIAQLLVDQVVVNEKGLTVRLRTAGLGDLVTEVRETAATAAERSQN